VGIRRDRTPTLRPPLTRLSEDRRAALGAVLDDLADRPVPEVES